MSDNASEKKWFNVASFGESYRQIKTCGIANIERIFRVEFEDRTIFSLIYF
jgi:cobalamin biosynthesis Co2+ chelatase CbiK